VRRSIFVGVLKPRVHMIIRMSIIYRVRARNTSTDSENKIHDDATAAKYGFRGGLVPGVTVYAYMTVPVVERFGSAWLERGSMQVRFRQPFYDGDEVIVRAQSNDNAERMNLTAERADGALCAEAVATISDRSEGVSDTLLDQYPEAPLPSLDARSPASREALIPKTVLGTLRERIAAPDAVTLENLDERLRVYSGADAIAHPFTLLVMSNYLLMRNYLLGPWIHASSDLRNLSAARNGEEISARGTIVDCFERKGHEFVVLDVLLVANNTRPVQRVVHTAIYKPRTDD